MNRSPRVAEAALALRIVIGTADMPDDPQTNFPEQGQAEAFEPRTPEELRAKDDILRVLSDFQQGLESLRVLHQQRSELQAKLLERETELALRSEELRERDRRLEAQKSDFETASSLLSDQESELARAREAHAAREQELEAATAALRERLDTSLTVEQDTATNNGQLRDELSSCRASLADAQRRADTLEQDLHRAAGRAAEAEAGLTETQRKLSHLSELASEFEALWHVERHCAAGLTAALQHAIDRVETTAREGTIARDETSELQSRLKARDEEFKQLESVLTQLRDRIKAEFGKVKDAAARADASDKALRERDDRITELTAKLAQAEAARASSAARSAPRSGESAARRRERLRRLRGALRDEHRRLKKGEEVLAKRFEQVESASKARAELAAVRDRVIAADRALQRRTARSKAAVSVLAILGSVSILGALSWAVARQVAPAMFVAESTVRADGRGRELNDAELEEWLRFHKDTLNDPRFHEEAAQRFARAGRADLGTGAAVAQLISSAVVTDSLLPGELKMELQFRGKDQARRTLETLTAALASYSNAAQQRRIDGGATVVPAAASADDRPIDDTQTYYALGIMAGGMVVAGLIGLGIFRKLASAKSAFEQDAHLASVLDESRWSRGAPG